MRNGRTGKRRRASFASRERPGLARCRLVEPRSDAFADCGNALRGTKSLSERNCTTQDRRLWFEKAAKKAGLRPVFHYHDLRHTFASRLAVAGVPLLEI